jgi:molybdenum-dependent DNA-binding transcriptional regulator ModE
MRATAKYDVSQGVRLPAQIRLLNAHSRLGSWKAVADGLGLNFRYVWDFAVNGKLPQNQIIRKKLLGKKSIGEHLAHDRIQDMPPPLLSWAFINREEIKEPIV